MFSKPKFNELQNELHIGSIVYNIVTLTLVRLDVFHNILFFQLLLSLSLSMVVAT